MVVDGGLAGGVALTLAVDLDGTLLKWATVPPVAAWHDAAMFATYEWSVNEALRDRLAGVEERIFIITGRGESLRALTEAQVSAILPGTPVLMQPMWRGWDRYLSWKVEAIHRVGAHTYLGDLPVDRRVAEVAGVHYLDVVEVAS